MTTPDGRVIFPGGKAEAKPFFKEMKKLINNWAVAMSRKYRHIQPSARRWADLADSIIDAARSSKSRRRAKSRASTARRLRHDRHGPIGSPVSGCR